MGKYLRFSQQTGIHPVAEAGGSVLTFSHVLQITYELGYG